MREFYIKHRLLFRSLVFLASFLIFCFIGDRYFPENEWEFWGLILFAVIVLVPQGIIFPIVRALGYKNDSSPCLKYSTQCCVEYFKKELANRYQNLTAIDNSTMSDFHLSRYNDMIELVRLFTSSDDSSIQEASYQLIKDEIPCDSIHKGIEKQIWFFSYDISHESFLGKVKSNSSFETNDVTFVYFHIQNDPAAEREKVKLLRVFKDVTLIFKEISIEQTSTSKPINVLPVILGSVIFIFKPQGEPLSFSSFFELKGKIKDPVYFQMPSCMNEDYYEYFRSLFEEAVQ